MYAPIQGWKMFAKIAGCNDIERFWSKVAKTEASLCWEWNGTKTDTGYGLFRIGSNIDGSRRTERAHRISYVLHTGLVIPDGMFVMHSCDNPSCVNPNHLSVGTPKENTHDAMNKGRLKKLATPRRQQNQKNKLSELTVQRIRLTKDYVPASFWAKITCTSRSAIYHVRNGTSWGDIKSLKQALG